MSENKLYRKLKLHYLKLIRLKSSPSIIARGYAIGILIEFITIPTLGLAFILLYPLTWLLRGSFAASIIGYISGKFIMLFFIYWNYYVGNLLIGNKITQQISRNIFSIDMLRDKGVALFWGSLVNGTLVAILSYVVVHYGLILYRKRRKFKTL